LEQADDTGAPAATCNRSRLGWLRALGLSGRRSLTSSQRFLQRQRLLVTRSSGKKGLEALLKLAARQQHLPLASKATQADIRA